MPRTPIGIAAAEPAASAPHHIARDEGSAGFVLRVTGSEALRWVAVGVLLDGGGVSDSVRVTSPGSVGVGGAVVVEGCFEGCDAVGVDDEGGGGVVGDGDGDGEAEVGRDADADGDGAAEDDAVALPPPSLSTGAAWPSAASPQSMSLAAW
ncbi:MAG: hypothetical protein JF587_23705, partial [Catenulisporales bacterium]|nr:hypothetical protein [Catenulisporales bacterium]